MTLLAAPASDITWAEDYSWVPEVPRAVRCQVPGCGDTWGLEPHHVVRRSHTSGPCEWVTVRGCVVQNVVMLCPFHHRQVTGDVGGHLARLWFVDGTGWVWYTRRRPRESNDFEPLLDKTGGLWLAAGPVG